MPSDMRQLPLLSSLEFFPLLHPATLAVSSRPRTVYQSTDTEEELGIVQIGCIERSSWADMRYAGGGRESKGIFSVAQLSSPGSSRVRLLLAS